MSKWTFLFGEQVSNHLSDLLFCYSANCCFLTPNIWLPTGLLFTSHFSSWQPHLAPADEAQSLSGSGIPLRRNAAASSGQHRATGQHAQSSAPASSEKHRIHLHNSVPLQRKRGNFSPSSAPHSEEHQPAEIELKLSLVWLVWSACDGKSCVCGCVFVRVSVCLWCRRSGCCKSQTFLALLLSRSVSHGRTPCSWESHGSISNSILGVWQAAAVWVTLRKATPFHHHFEECCFPVTKLQKLSACL